MGALAIGDRFGRLTLIKEDTGERKQEHVIGIWKCGCGVEKEFYNSNVRSGHTKSCGCLQRETRVKTKTTHGMRKTRQYRIWGHIKHRCDNRKNANYKNYGGRGIKYPSKWKSFKGFWEDMGNGYKNNLSINRIDNNQGYSKENCNWASGFEQAQNKRNNVNYKQMCAYEGSRKLGGSKSLINSRMKMGWSKEKAFTTPRRSKNGS